MREVKTKGNLSEGVDKATDEEEEQCEKRRFNTENALSTFFSLSLSEI